MRRSKDLIMTAFDQSRSISNDHNHAGEVGVPDRTTHQYRSTGTAAICPVGSQIPTNPSIPIGIGCPEGRAASHDSTDRGFSRHKSATVIRTIPSHRSAWTMTRHVRPKVDMATTLIHSGNGTGTMVCSPSPEGLVSHTINRMLITNNAHDAETNGHKIKPIPSAQPRLMRYGSRPPESSHIPHQLRSVLKTGRQGRFDSTAQSNGPEGTMVRFAELRPPADALQTNGHKSRQTHRFSPDLCDMGHDRPKAVIARISSDPF